jgi:hypothetical protein
LVLFIAHGADRATCVLPSSLVFRTPVAPGLEAGRAKLKRLDVILPGKPPRRNVPSCESVHNVLRRTLSRGIRRNSDSTIIHGEVTIFVDGLGVGRDGNSRIRSRARSELRMRLRRRMPGRHPLQRSQSRAALAGFELRLDNVGRRRTRVVFRYLEARTVYPDML